jgi:hypothetical protein
MRQPTTNMSMAAIPYLSGELRQVGEGVPRLSHHSTRTETIECMSVSMLATQWSRCQNSRLFRRFRSFQQAQVFGAAITLCPSTYLKHR